jgi:adenylate cyclase
MHGELALLQGGDSVRRSRRRANCWRFGRRAAAWTAAAAVFTLMVIVAGRVRQRVANHDEKLSTNQAANTLFRTGKTHFDLFRGTNMALAADNFEKAIRIDPKFAAAHGYLAATLFWGGFSDWNPKWQFLPRAKEEALLALKLDDRLAEPHLALGWYYAMGEWNWSQAEKEHKRAIALNGSSQFVHLCYGELLRMCGRTDEALQQITLARSSDPHSKLINVRLIHYLGCAHRFEEALAQMDQAVLMEALSEKDVMLDRIDMSLALHQIDKVLDEEHDLRIASGEPRKTVDYDTAYNKGIGVAEATRVVWRGRLKSDEQHDDVYSQARCHAQLGQTDDALRCLEKLLDNRDTVLTFNIKGDWALDPIRSHWRFHAILKKMHWDWE